MKLLRETIKGILLEGIRNTDQGAQALVDVMLDDPSLDVSGAAKKVFSNYEWPESRAAERFHDRSIGKVGKEIARRLALTGADPHHNDQFRKFTQQENELMDLYHNLPSSLHDYD